MVLLLPQSIIHSGGHWVPSCGRLFGSLEEQGLLLGCPISKARGSSKTTNLNISTRCDKDKDLLMAGTDRATTIMAIGTIVSALATVWLATGTRSLAKGTNKLVKAAKVEAELNAAANQRSYALAIYQIERQTRVETYEALVGYIDDSLLRLELQASALGLAFDGQTVGTPHSVEELAQMTTQIFTKLALHGTLEITDFFGVGLRRMTQMAAELNSLETRDGQGGVQRIQNSALLSAAQTNFKENHDWLKNWYLDVLLKIDAQLHPDRDSFDMGVIKTPQD